jgi:hypothetical protein
MAETTEMQEIILENIDLQAFYGIGNENLARLKEAYLRSSWSLEVAASRRMVIR